VLKVSVWILGEYSASTVEIDDAFSTIKENIGTLPLAKEVKEEEKKASEESSNAPKVITKTIILPDGSYGTETVVVDPTI